MTQKRSDLDFISDVLINALNDKREDIIPDIYKMYEEIRNRPTIPGNIEIGNDTITFDGQNSSYNFNLTSQYIPGVASMIDFNNSNDVISFGDYESREDS